jgi:hypothetical protein
VRCGESFVVDLENLHHHKQLVIPPCLGGWRLLPWSFHKRQLYCRLHQTLVEDVQIHPCTSSSSLQVIKLIFEELGSDTN